MGLKIKTSRLFSISILQGSICKENQAQSPALCRAGSNFPQEKENSCSFQPQELELFISSSILCLDMSQDPQTQRVILTPPHQTLSQTLLLLFSLPFQQALTHSPSLTECSSSHSLCPHLPTPPHLFMLSFNYAHRRALGTKSISLILPSFSPASNQFCLGKCGQKGKEEMSLISETNHFGCNKQLSLSNKSRQLLLGLLGGAFPIMPHVVSQSNSGFLFPHPFRAGLWTSFSPLAFLPFEASVLAAQLSLCFSNSSYF